MRNYHRMAVLAAFFANGAVLASWIARIPAVQAKLGMQEATLGLTMFGLSSGVFTALFFAGSLIAKYGSQKVTFISGLLQCCLLPFLALMPHPILLFINLFLFGASASSMDMAMNEQAVLVEKKEQRTLMSSFHASYSIGGLVGALIGAFMARSTQTPILLHFILITVIFLVLLIWVYSHLIPTNDNDRTTKTGIRLPQKGLLLLGLVIFCSSITEGAVADWNGVYLTDVLSTSNSFAALGFAAFSMTMTIGRLLGDSLTQRFKATTIVRCGAILTVLGLFATIFTNNPYLALLGFAAVGLGVANIIPLSFSSAGNSASSPGAGISGAASIGYAGFLIGPPLIGFLAEQFSLRISFTVIAILASSMILTARALKK